MLAKGDRAASAVGARLVALGVCAAAAVVVATGLQHAWTSSNDFQWSGARLLLEGRDPYQALFDGDVSAFRWTQFPNYAPLLYVLLLPLAIAPLSAAQSLWAFVNLVMLVGAALLVARGVGLAGWKRVCLVALVFVSEPFLVALANGQQTALALFAAVLAVRSANDVGTGAGLGLMLVKYSFAPVALVAVAGRRWKAAGVALAVQVSGLLAFWLITGSPLLATTLAPFRAAEMTQASGSGDVITLTRLVTGSETVGFVVAAVLGAVLAWHARCVLAGPHWVDALAAGSLISLLVFPHLVYDHCFLLPVAGSAVLRRGAPRAALFAVVAVLWYGWLVGHWLLMPYLLPGVVTTVVLLALALVVLVRSAQDAAGPAPEVVQPGTDAPRSALA